MTPVHSLERGRSLARLEGCRLAGILWASSCIAGSAGGWVNRQAGGRKRLMPDMATRPEIKKIPGLRF